MKKVVRPIFSLAGNSGPSSVKITKFSQGFALDFPGGQQHGVLDKDLVFAQHFNEQYYLTCLEIMATREQMVRSPVHCWRQEADRTKALQITNAGCCDSRFRVQIYLDESKNLVEVRVSNRRPHYIVIYSNIATLELTRGGELVRVVIDFAQVSSAPNEFPQDLEKRF